MGGRSRQRVQYAENLSIILAIIDVHENECTNMHICRAELKLNQSLFVII